MMENLIQILFSYDFLVVAIGTVLLAIPSAIVGCFSVYKGQSLMADAVGHASYPGVVVAFMLFSIRSSVILTLGAAVFGILAYLTIQLIRKHSVIDFDAGTHKEILAHLDYDAPPCPACKGQMAKYDFQKPSKIPYLETAGYKTLIRLKKHRFRCKNCGKMAVAETSLVQKNHQIAAAVKQKIAQLLVEKQAMTDIAHRLSISTSTVIRKLKEFKFETNWQKLPEIMSWDEYNFKKGKMSFISFCSFTFRKSKLIISLT